MSALLDAIRADAERRGETLAQGVRHHLMHGVVGRLARTPAGDSFVLRGGLLTRAWVEPVRRPTRDLDYVGDFAFDVDDTVRRIRAALDVELDDGVRIDRGRFAARGIWLDTEFPGVRVTLALGLGTADQELGIDIGFRDPLVPAATTAAIGDSLVRAVRPETQLAWKLHCLAEMAAGWRPKDVADLWLIVNHVTLERAALAPAIEAAFTSRGYAPAQAIGVLHEPRWATKTARLRWEPYRGQPRVLPVLPTLDDAIAGIRAALEDR